MFLAQSDHRVASRRVSDRSAWDVRAELELVKERFSKLLLGEDMSGSGKGVCTAVAISNAITNLYGKQCKQTPDVFVYWASGTHLHRSVD